jgi:hypothetical protein
VGVEYGTTMRERRQARPNSNTQNNVQAPAVSSCGAVQVERVFRPDDLDLDDLAEAIRSLLGPSSPPQSGSPSCPGPDLLSLLPRVTHVVEANEGT